MKRSLYTYIAVGILLPAIALGGAIKSWSALDTLNASDLNANFSHIHGTMVGGHGARLVNADVSSSAGIAHSKMETPALLPKAWGQIASCVGGGTVDTVTCTPLSYSRLTGVKNNGTTGSYRVTLSYTPANTNFAVLVTSNTAGRFCTATGFATSAPQFVVSCTDGAIPTAQDSAFSFLVLDNDN